MRTRPGPAVFAPVRGSCHANAVSDGAVSLPAWLCSLLLLPPGSPLPCAIRLGLRHPGGALFYVHECVRSDGQADRSGVVYVRDPVASGLTPSTAPSCLARASREVFNAFAPSSCAALLLQPLGCARLPISKAAVLSMAVIQLAAGCLDVPSTSILRSRPLGMTVRSAAVLRAIRSAEIMRRAVPPSIGGDAVPEGGMDNRAAATGGAEAGAGGLGSRPPDGGIAPARGVRAAHGRIALSLSADERARMHSASLHLDPAGTPVGPTGRGERGRRAARKGAASGAPEEPSHATFARDTVLPYKAGA